MDKNPTRPNESPIKTEHSGGWDNSYRNYVRPNSEPKRGLSMPVFGRNRGDGVTNYDDIHDYQKSKTPEAIEDKRLEQAVKQDLKRRNIK